MKVCKFGGSSLADAGQISKVMDIVLADPARRMVVVSAPGKRNKSDTKVTDLLIALADAALAKKDTTKPLKAVVDRYASIAKELKLGEAIVKEIAYIRQILQDDWNDIVSSNGMIDELAKKHPKLANTLKTGVNKSDFEALRYFLCLNAERANAFPAEEQAGWPGQRDPCRAVQVLPRGLR